MNCVLLYLKQQKKRVTIIKLATDTEQYFGGQSEKGVKDFKFSFQCMFGLIFLLEMYCIGFMHVHN